MNTKINAIHFDITEKLTAFINKKAEKLSRRIVDMTDMEVNLKVVKPETVKNKEAAIKVIVPQHEEFFASKVADSFEEAIDLCLDAIERQFEKKKNAK